MDFPIAPGAALTDPRLQQAVAQRVGRRMGREDALRIQNILAHYPWREYGYKYGRWQRVDTLLNTGYKWGQVFESFVLVDTTSGQEIGELTAEGLSLFKLAKFSGKLWFAGEPTVAGVYSPAGDGVQDLRFVRSPFIEQKAVKEQALAMRPGHNPPLPQATPGATAKLTPEETQKRWAAPYTRGPWIVDHPDKPPKPPSS
ncbi:MAG TPA: hypothetical protein VG317_22740 [Pseudonocardiaceae bacterium]|jgi:hypothetical protein|nr:hypothetical protein [Pseudonocardiaceae bacterium]